MIRRLRKCNIEGLGIVVPAIHSRQGKAAPWLLILEVNGRRITPFERRIKGINIPITLEVNWLFQFIYSDVTIANLTYAKNPLLALIPKEPTWAGSHYPVPIVF